MQSNEKKYLSFTKKIAYGTGDLGSNFFYMLVSAFVLIYLTDTVGLNAGIVGTLMMLAKFLDGITDVIFGRLVDNTHSKMGKARPWMFWSAFPLGLTLIMMFTIPANMPQVAQYAYFFVAYAAANAFFYTANNIAYATMSALITKNNTERVSLGTYRYIFAVTASIVVSGITVPLVNVMGGGAIGWRNVAILYALIQLLFSSIASLVCKEVPETEAEIEEGKKHSTAEKKDSIISMFKIVLSNKYYLIILGIYLLLYASTGIGSGIGVYFCKYILGDASLLGVISMGAIVMIVGLIANPSLVKRFGMYKVNLVSYIITTILSTCLMLAAFAGSFIGVLIFALLRGITSAPLMGSLNALVAEVSAYTYKTKNIRADGMMFSCSSVGIKVGGGIGTALGGWLLSAAGYVGNVTEQSAAVLNMIKFSYGAIPFVLTLLITLLLWNLKVVEENMRLDANIAA